MLEYSKRRYYYFILLLLSIFFFQCGKNGEKNPVNSRGRRQKSQKTENRNGVSFTCSCCQSQSPFTAQVLCISSGVHLTFELQLSKWRPHMGAAKRASLSLPKSPVCNVITGWKTQSFTAFN